MELDATSAISTFRPQILVVADKDESLIKVLNTLVYNCECDLVWVSSATPALQMAAEQEFALILFDMPIPETHGVEIFKNLKAHSKSELTPLVFITPQKLSEEQEIQAYQMGIADIILKPLTPETLAAKLTVFVELFRARKDIQTDADKAVRDLLKGMVGTNTDIDEKSRTRQQLIESNERYKLLFESSPLPKKIFDVETFQVLDVNHAAIRLYGYSREEFLNMRATDISPKEDIEQFENATHESYGVNQPFTHKSYRHVKKDGSIIFVESSAHDLVLNGRKARIVAIVDVTEKLKTEERQQELWLSLKVAKEEAERASQLKSAFLANMSHEIRTPLGAILGFADLLKDETISKYERAQFLDVISRNGKALTRIIDDILDLAKVEAGKLEIEQTEFSLCDLMNDVMDLFGEQTRAKGIFLQAILERSKIDHIVSDPTRLRQILINIIGNAVKFTADGGVTIEVIHCKGDKERIHFQIAVKDTGVGMSSEHQFRIFEPFTQADSAMTRKFGGTGLGLSLSKRLAKALNGDVYLKDCDLNQGCVFIISFEATLPVATATPNLKEVIKTDTNDTLSGTRILIADDSPDNLFLVSRILGNAGAQIDTASNGSEAYAKGVSGLYDVILMDIQMPEMDGYEVTRLLKEADIKTPVIALTAHATPEERLRSLAAGCIGHLTKPIDHKELLATICSNVTCR